MRWREIKRSKGKVMEVTSGSHLCGCCTTSLFFCRSVFIAERQTVDLLQPCFCCDKMCMSNNVSGTCYSEDGTTSRTCKTDWPERERQAVKRNNLEHGGGKKSSKNTRKRKSGNIKFSSTCCSNPIKTIRTENVLVVEVLLERWSDWRALLSVWPHRIAW